jgi:hypothetical protein
VKLQADPALAAILPGRVPERWATRAAFLHPAASDLWRRAAAAPDALETSQAVISMYASLAHAAGDGFRLFISLGAGGGLADAALVRSLPAADLQYVPVDLSKDLCLSSARHLQTVCPVPLCVVGDFEGGFAYVRDALDPLRGRRKLFCCTSTIGNLDLGERRFLDVVCDVMAAGDCVLLSMGTGAFGGPIDRSLLDGEIEWRSLGGLLSCGIAMLTGESLHDVQPRLAGRLDARKGESDVPGAEAVELWDRTSGRTLLHLRRYDVDAMARWIERSFPLKIVRADAFRPPARTVGMGALILRRS